MPWPKACQFCLQQNLDGPDCDTGFDMARGEMENQTPGHDGRVALLGVVGTHAAKADFVGSGRNSGFWGNEFNLPGSHTRIEA